MFPLTWLYKNCLTQFFNALMHTLYLCKYRPLGSGNIKLELTIKWHKCTCNNHSSSRHACLSTKLLQVEIEGGTPCLVCALYSMFIIRPNFFDIKLQVYSNKNKQMNKSLRFNRHSTQCHWPCTLESGDCFVGPCILNSSKKMFTYFVCTKKSGICIKKGESWYRNYSL